MRHKKLLKKIAALGGAACLALTVLVSPIATMPVQAAAPGIDAAQPQHDIIKWVFKEENGGLYRRLYNFSVNNWVGDWEYVGPL